VGEEEILKSVYSLANKIIACVCRRYSEREGEGGEGGGTRLYHSPVPQMSRTAKICKAKQTLNLKKLYDRIDIACISVGLICGTSEQ